MQKIFSILLLSLSVVYCYAQKKPFLQQSDFKQLELSDSWIIVKYKPESVPKSSAHTKVLDRRVHDRPSILDGMVKVRLQKEENAIDACNRLLKDPNVLYAEPIIHDYPLFTTSDPLAASQYYLANIKAREAWEITTGDDDITIAIIDTGMDLDHEDLITNIWLNENDPIDGVDNDENGFIDDYRGYDFADDDNNPEADQNPHGARVAGVAGATADNGLGIAGVGFNTKIAALKGFRTSNGTSRGLFDAIMYAADNGMQVMNLSWGSIRKPLQSEQDIINYAVLEKDVVIVAAAGNDGNKSTAEEKFYPASYDNVLSVGGSEASDNKWSGSSYNYAVDLIAPAASILSTSSGNSYNSTGGFGTSFASPMVAAAAALVKDQFPQLSSQQIMERVRVTADDIYDIGNNAIYEGKLGRGRLNILRAVSESNVKSLRAENPSLTSSHGTSIFFGDTVRVTAMLTNFLGSANDPGVYVSSPNSAFSISKDSFFPGSMGSLTSKEISFEIILSEAIQPETNVDIRLDFEDGFYTDFQYLEVTTSPDYTDFGNESLSMTIAGNGDLGLVEYGFEEVGSGLVYELDTLLKFTGILLATDENSVADNIISDYSTFIRGNDFISQKNYKLYHHPAADHFGYSEFADVINNLIIEQSNISWDNEDFLIIRYRIINNNAAPITNLTCAVYTDWELGNPFENYAAYDEANNYLFARNNTSDLFAATKVIGAGNVRYCALDKSNENGNTQDVFNELSDAMKFDFLHNQTILEAGSVGNGNDVAGIHGITIGQIDAYADTYVDLIYAVSDSKTNLESVFTTAQTRLNEFLLQPRVLETFYTCNGIAVNIDPSGGTEYEFFEDALGISLITTSSNFNPGTITRDTSFYVRNVDESYPSDLFEIRVKFLNDIADFTISKDTLYLDNQTNTVQFSDQSMDAISWTWDFGEGSQSTIQHPSFAFNEPGSYTISLTVENQQGCIDSITKNLVVANRPATPSFDDYLICPGDNVILSYSGASKLKIYAKANSLNEVASGIDFSFGPFLDDTTVFVSAIIDGYETGKAPVNIITYDIKSEFRIMPDTLSESHQLKLIADLDESSSVEWFVNESPQGSAREVSIAVNPGTYSVRLEVLSSEGCSLTTTKNFTVSTSPFASASDITSCAGGTAVLVPKNGTYFGFYADDNLTALISKGRQLAVTESTKVYVVGLDDGLPGIPIEVDISFDNFTATITHTTSRVGTKNKVALSAVSETNITAYRWFVDDELMETVTTPSFFFDDVVTEVVLEATNGNGCVTTDTIQFDFTPPLGISKSDAISAYPNPTRGPIHLQYDGKIDEVLVRDMTGKEIGLLDIQQNMINLSGLKRGLYLLEFILNDEKHELKVVLE